MQPLIASALYSTGSWETAPCRVVCCMLLVLLVCCRLGCLCVPVGCCNNSQNAVFWSAFISKAVPFCSLEIKKRSSLSQLDAVGICVIPICAGAAVDLLGVRGLPS